MRFTMPSSQLPGSMPSPGIRVILRSHAPVSPGLSPSRGALDDRIACLPQRAQSGPSAAAVAHTRAARGARSLHLGSDVER